MEKETEILLREYLKTWKDTKLVDNDKIVGLNNLTDSNSRIPFRNSLQPTLLIDPNTMLPQYAQTDVQTVTETSTQADISYDITSGRIWEIVAIIGAIDSDATVANRTWRIAAGDSPPVPVVGATRSLQTSVITLSANENGQIIMFSGPNHWTNDNGTVAMVSNENCLPMILTGPAVIDLENSAANSGAGDSLGLTIKYRRLA